MKIRCLINAGTEAGTEACPLLDPRTAQTVLNNRSESESDRQQAVKRIAKATA